MTYAEVMARDSSDFWLMLWPLYLIAGAWLVGLYAQKIRSRK